MMAGSRATTTNTFSCMSAAAFVSPSETAFDLFQRVPQEPFHPGQEPFKLGCPGGLAPGSVVEVYGKAGVGKTEIVLDWTVTTVLPETWAGVPLGGRAGSVLFLDTEFKFRPERLSQLLRSRVSRVCQANGKGASDDELDGLVEECLERVVVMSCENSVQFLASVLSIRTASEVASVPVRLVVIDSIGAYAWQERAEARAGALNVYGKVVLGLRAVLKDYGTVVVATKPAIYRHDDELSTAEHREYLPSEWRALVTHRLALARLWPPGAVPVTADCGPEFVARLQSGSTVSAAVGGPAPQIAFSISDGGLTFDDWTSARRY